MTNIMLFEGVKLPHHMSRSGAIVCHKGVRIADSLPPAGNVFEHTYKLILLFLSKTRVGSFPEFG